MSPSPSILLSEPATIAAQDNHPSANRSNTGTPVLHLNIFEGDNYNVARAIDSNFGGRNNTNKIESSSSSHTDKGFDLLTENIAPDAFHDSGFAADPTKCHPETRTAILTDLQNWAEGEDQDYPIKWVKGSAGVGKTVIMRTTAESLAKKKLLLASFFFWRTGQKCNTAQYFVATIAYQICQVLPACRPLIARAVQTDPHIFSKNLEAQLQVLVIRPLATVYRGGPRIIMIDGLDECLAPGTHYQDIERQCEILRVMHSTLQQLRQLRIPISILFASRPETHIQTAFDDFPPDYISSTFLNDSYDATEDIRRFYMEKFREIRRPYPHLNEWPSSLMIDVLVSRASGQFIYASTVVHFIKAGNPSKQLNVILNLQEHGEMRPLRRLDLLYKTILLQVREEDLASTLQLLGILLAEDRFRTRSQSPAFWDSFLGWEQGEVQHLSNGLESVLAVPRWNREDKEERFRFYHASFQEFLFSRSRSESFFIDQNLAYEDMVKRCIQHLFTQNDDISSYLWQTMEEWLSSINLRFIVQFLSTFNQEGLSVYPPNFAVPYPALLLAFKLKRHEEEYGMDELYQQWGFYVAQLKNVLKQYFAEDALTLFLLGSLAGVNLLDWTSYSLGGLGSDSALASLGRVDNTLLRLGSQTSSLSSGYNVLGGAIRQIIDDMSSKDILFAKAASFFVDLLNKEKVPESNLKHRKETTLLMQYLLQSAAPLDSLGDSLRKFSIPEYLRGQEMDDALREYFSRLDDSKAGSKTPKANAGFLTAPLEYTRAWLSATAASLTCQRPKSLLWAKTTEKGDGSSESKIYGREIQNRRLDALLAESCRLPDSEDIGTEESVKASRPPLRRRDAGLVVWSPYRTVLNPQ